jgi:hypothetical protein
MAKQDGENRDNLCDGEIQADALLDPCRPNGFYLRLDRTGPGAIGE